MTCIDKGAAARILGGTEFDVREWATHLEKCEACRDFLAGVGALADSSDQVVHPGGSALVVYDEQPGALDEGSRAWIFAHLKGCAECTEALARVPILQTPPARPVWRRPPMIATAAALLAAVILANQLFDGEVVVTPPAGPDLLALPGHADLDAPIERIAMPDIPVPFNVGLMKAVLPDSEKIAQAMKDCLDI